MKKIKSLAIMILMITALIILSAKVEATTGKINAETVRVRKEASTKSTILTQLDKEEVVEILEQSEGWYKVEITKNGEKITGYISESLVDLQEDETNTKIPTEKPEENNATSTNTEPEQNNEQIPVEEPTVESNTNIEVNKDYTIEQEIKVKILPLINSREKVGISSGNIKVLEIINDWCKVENDTQSGWIRTNILKKSIKISDQVPAEQPNKETPAENNTNKKPETTPVNTTVIKTGYVSTDSLKVRKEATTSSEMIDSLVKNSQVSIIEELDGWYKIKIGNQIGYVSSKYISDKKVEETTSRGSTSRNENVSEMPEQEQPQEDTTSTTTSSGTAVVEYAKQYVGYKYVSGGTSPATGFDCSGFTTYVFKHFGVTLNRVSRDQIKNGVAVEKSNLQPGDLVLFNGESNKTIGHVGIYVGGGEFIHAANPKEGVKITALSSSYYKTRYVGARRVI